MQTPPEPSRTTPAPTSHQDDGFFSLRITLQTIELLDAIARHGDITAAAEALSMPPDTLTTALQTLEASLGFTLFYPGSPSTRPTPACLALLEEGRCLRQARSAADSPDDKPPGP